MEMVREVYKMELYKLKNKKQNKTNKQIHIHGPKQTIPGLDSHTRSKCSEFKHAGLFYTKNTLMQPPKSAFFSAVRIQMNTDKDSICYLVSKPDLCLF